MSRTKFTAGISGILSVLIFGIATAVSIVRFSGGVYSPLNCFVTELGFYTKNPGSSVSVFNAGLIVSGLILCVFMILLGVHKSNSIYTAASFFGVLSGAFLSAQGIFTLNYKYHYFILIDFLASVFITCVLFIIAEMLLEKKRGRVLRNIITFFAGITSILFCGFVFTNGLAEVFYEDSMGVGRFKFIPFAAIGWAAYILFFLFILIISIELFSGVKASFRNVPDQVTGQSKKQAAKKADTRDIEL